MALTDQTFLQLITRLAHELNDAMSLAATSNGSTTTFVDNVNINSSRESYDGWEWFGTSSPNSDVIATVTTTSVSTITITPAVTSTTTGSTALLVNRRGRGFRIQDYKRAINGAIQDFNGLARIPVVETIAAVFDADTGTIAIPADLAEAYRVEWQDSSARWREVKPSLVDGGNGWTAEPANAVIRIEGDPAEQVDGYTVRIHGCMRVRYRGYRGPSRVPAYPVVIGPRSEVRANGAGIQGRKRSGDVAIACLADAGNHAGKALICRSVAARTQELLSLTAWRSSWRRPRGAMAAT